MKVLPFLKWAGGKRWFVDNHAHHLEIGERRYIEPFLGSGAVFFNSIVSCAILSDSNYALIETYSALKSNYERVLEHLRNHHRLHSKEYYYSIRSKKFRSEYTRAAQFIYLNRTCWNGLYRVNKNGEFNVPIGTKSNVILDSDDFHKISEKLKNAELECSDFESVIDRTGEGDFLFVDPPYTVQHNHNGFVKYNEKIFSWNDQLRLKDSLVRAKERGAKILLTNAYHPSVIDLYQDLAAPVRLIRSSVISGANKSRGKYEELMISC